jgi:DNA-binding Lrp family transcriptional regulator
MNLSDLDKNIIKVLQEDLPLSPRPYKDLAEKIGIEEELLLSKIQFYIDNGIIRRFGSALRHREIGFSANAMVVWKVEPDRTMDAGRIMAEFKEVSHCYERPTYPGWPYNLFTMVHGQTPEECENIADCISKKTGLSEYKLLYSNKELKKTSMKYFVE